VPPLKACLVDVYDTILASAFPQRQRELAILAGVDDDQWRTEWLRLSLDRDVGALSMAAAFERTLAACGRDLDPALVSRLVARDAELIISHTNVFADTVPFLAKARAAGLGIALVSNCAENTRALLAAKGLLDLADAAILSCEAGLAKPDPEIYLLAVQALGVSPADAVMLDDQPRFCAGATAAGLRAIQVARPEVGGQPPDPRFTPVTTLHDVLPLLSLPGRSLPGRGRRTDLRGRTRALASRGAARTPRGRARALRGK
jgi:HAD superfamily hydrolase (TIGR01509 family)